MSYHDDETEDASLTIEPDWKRSTFCASGSCVEVARTAGPVLVRDGKDRELPHLAFTPDAWQAFIDDVKAGVLC